MTSSLWPIFIVNIGINSLLSFFTVELLVLTALMLLCIRNPRLRAFCLLLPFIKLGVDLTFYEFSNWALAQAINPFDCAEGTRMISVGIGQSAWYPLCYINLFLQEGQTFTLADLLCLKIGPHWTLFCAIALLAGSLVSLGYAIGQNFRSRQWLKEIGSKAVLYSGAIHDPFLQKEIQQKRVSIYLTSSAHSPFIVSQRKPSIFIPRSLFDQLSLQEFEAILAHEMAHHRHGDMIANTALFWISHLFWWIPTRYLKKQIELAQEYACDRLLKTSLHRNHLAEALYKASAWLHVSPPFASAQPFAASHHAVNRLKVLLASPKQDLFFLKWIKAILLIGWIAILTFGKFWAF